MGWYAAVLQISVASTQLTDAQWEQAARGISFGGLGLRSTSTHAAAAYLASLGGSLDACAALDASFSPDVVKGSPSVHQAAAMINTKLSLSDYLTVDAALGCRQRELSRRLDVASWNSQLSRSTLVEQASLRSEAEAGARAFLTATPSGPGRMEGPAFVAELRVRLGVPDASSDTWCPRCDAVLDTMSHHAPMCAAGGERTQRHHAVRDVVFR